MIVCLPVHQVLLRSRRNPRQEQLSSSCYDAAPTPPPPTETDRHRSYVSSPPCIHHSSAPLTCLQDTSHTHPPPCQQDSLFPRNPSLASQPPTHTTLEFPQSLLPHSGEVATSCPGRKAERALHQTAAQVVLAWTSAVSRLPVPGAQLSGLLGPSNPTLPAHCPPWFKVFLQL